MLAGRDIMLEGAEDVMAVAGAAEEIIYRLSIHTMPPPEI
jgi:hypothetical protein